MPILGSTGGASVRAFLPVSFKRRLPGWSYGKKIVIPNQQVDANLTNFPVTVYLDSTNFDFSKAKADGADIRFTDKDYNHLKFERKEHNFLTTSTATAYLQGINFVTNGSTYIYEAYQGNTPQGSCYTPEPGFLLDLRGINVTSIEVDADYAWYNSQPAISVVGGTGYTVTAGTSTSNATVSGGTNVYYENLYTTYGNLATGERNVQRSYTFSGGRTDLTLWFLSASCQQIGNRWLKIKSIKVNGTPIKTISSTSYTTSVSFNNQAVYNVLLPTVSDTVDTEFYMWYGNSAAYNTSIEAWQDQTGKQLTYNGNVKLLAGVSQTLSMDKLPTEEGWGISGTGNQPASLSLSNGILSFGSNPATEYGYVKYSPLNSYPSTKRIDVNIKRISGDGLSGRGMFINIGDGNKGTRVCLANDNSLSYYNGSSYVNIATGQDYTSTFSKWSVTLNPTDGMKVYKNDVQVGSTVPYSSLTNYTANDHFSFSTNQATSCQVDYVTVNNDISNTSNNVKRIAYFDGNTDYISVPTTSDFDLYSNNFCIEAIINSNFPNSNVQHILQTGTAGTNRSVFYLTSSKQLSFYTEVPGNFGARATSTSTLSPNTTYHVSLVKSGNTFSLYINGVLDGTSTTTVYPVGSQAMHIGYQPFGSVVSDSYGGFIGGIRITKGRARYTSNFTPPTSFVIDGTDVVFNTNFDTVYDSNYVMVQHMGSSLVDASGSGNSATETNTSLTSTPYGTARLFNGTNSQILSSTIPASISQKTFVSLYKLSNITQTGGGLIGFQDTSGNYFDTVTYNETSNGWGFGSESWTRTSWSGIKEGSSDYWGAIGSSYDNNAYVMYINDIVYRTNSFAVRNFNTSSNVIIGKRHGAASSGSYLAATISECRFSNIVRSPSWVKLELNSLKNTVLEFADVDDSLLLSKEYELLGDITVGTATTSISFNNLDISPEDELIITCTVVNPSTTNASGYNLFVNGNTTTSNYYCQYIDASNTTVSSGRLNSTTAMYEEINAKGYAQIKIKLTNNGVFTYQCNNEKSIGSTANKLTSVIGSSTFTISSINSINVQADTTSIGAGSRFQLYKINGTAVV